MFNSASANVKIKCFLFFGKQPLCFSLLCGTNVLVGNGMICNKKNFFRIKYFFNTQFI